MTEKTWKDYRPPSAEWLKKTELSNRQIYRGLNQYRVIVKSLLPDVDDILGYCDEIIGPGEILDNRNLGKLFHLRRLLLEKFGHKHRAIRIVRRWDRRMIAAMPKRDE